MKPLPASTANLYAAARSGDVDTLKACLSEESVGIKNIEAALAYAAGDGRLEAVELLAKSCDPKAFDSAALRRAAFNGHVDAVKFLIPLSDMDTDGLVVIANAANRLHLDVIDILLPHLTATEHQLIEEMDVFPQAAQDRIRAHLDAKALSELAAPAQHPRPSAKPGGL